jgi:hypothetical protein
MLKQDKEHAKAVNSNKKSAKKKALRAPVQIFCLPLEFTASACLIFSFSTEYYFTEVFRTVEVQLLDRLP